MLTSSKIIIWAWWHPFEEIDAELLKLEKKYRGFLEVNPKDDFKIREEIETRLESIIISRQTLQEIKKSMENTLITYEDLIVRFEQE